MADKVKFGIKNVHYAVMTAESPLAYGTPVAIPGAVSFSLEPSGDSTPFYADNRRYFTSVANNGYTGDLEVALFPESFLTDIFGYTEDGTDKVVTENANTQPKSFALLFEEDGDTTGTKYVMFNCTATRPSKSLSTTTDSKEVQTQTISVTASALADGRTIAFTSADTPSNVVSAWYNSVWGI